jgi:hypothetical protein
VRTIVRNTVVIFNISVTADGLLLEDN